MIQTKIEQAVAEFIARNYIASGVATGDVEQRGTVLAFTGALAGQPDLRIHPGETDAEAILPAVLVVAGDGEEDDLGNQTIDVNIRVLFPFDPDNVQADQLTRLDEEFERVFSFAADDAIGEQMASINTITTDVSIIGIETRSSRREFEERRAVRELTLRAYCADVAVY